MHSKLPVALLSIIIQDGKILLLQRQNTPWMNGFRWVPGGRLDVWETMTIWAIRELKEEAWIEVKEEDILLKALVQHKDERGERLYFVIHTEKFSGEPTNMEPEKCAWLERFDIQNLPENVTPQVEICLEAVLKKINFQEYGY